MTPSPLRFRVLGPIAIEVDGELRPVPGGRRHEVLAALLVAGPGGISQRRLADLFDIDEPDTGESTVRSWVTRVRGLLGEIDPRVTVDHRAQGYVLDRGPAEVDADQFDAGVARARGAMAVGDHATAADVATEALALWRGPAYGTAAHLAVVRPETTRLDELRLQARELHAAALLELARGDEATSDLLAAAEEAPEREELRRLLMLALARADRHVEQPAGLEACRLSEPIPRSLVGTQALDPPPGSVQSDHEQGPPSLSKGIVVCGRLEEADSVTDRALLQQELRPSVDGHRPQLLEPDTGSRCAGGGRAAHRSSRAIRTARGR